MKKNRLLTLLFTLLIGVFTYAQTSVNGTVTDNQGQPIPGVAVIIAGTSQGTTTDFDGNFSIEVGEGQQLEISSIGFTTHCLLYTSPSPRDRG